MVAGLRNALFRLFCLEALTYTPQNAPSSRLPVPLDIPDADRGRSCSMALALPGSAQPPSRSLFRVVLESLVAGYMSDQRAVRLDAETGRYAFEQCNGAQRNGTQTSA